MTKRLVASGKHISSIHDIGTERLPLFKVVVDVNMELYEAVTDDLGHASNFQFDVEWYYLRYLQASNYYYAIRNRKSKNHVRVSFCKARMKTAWKELISFVEKNCEVQAIEDTSAGAGYGQH